MEDRRLEQLVTPFYLRMMGLNALAYCGARAPSPIDSQVAKAGRSASRDEVVALLRDSWRPRVMGAWFALLHDEEAVAEAVLASLSSSAGSLTSPPLAVVAVTLVGSRALDALEDYATQDIAHEWGACGFVAAAMTHLGAVPGTCHPTDDDKADFEGLLAVAARLRAAR